MTGSARQYRKYRRDKLTALTEKPNLDAYEVEKARGFMAELEVTGQDGEFIEAIKAKLGPALEPVTLTQTPGPDRVESEGKTSPKANEPPSEAAKQASTNSKSLLELLKPDSESSELVGQALYEIFSEAAPLISIYAEMDEAIDANFCQAWEACWKGKSKERAQKAMNSTARIWKIVHPASYDEFEKALRGDGKVDDAVTLGAILPEILSLVIFGAILYKALAPFVKISIEQMKAKEKELEAGSPKGAEA